MIPICLSEPNKTRLTIESSLIVFIAEFRRGYLVVPIFQHDKNDNARKSVGLIQVLIRSHT